MTDDRMALLGLVEKEADSDLVHEMLAFADGRSMKMEVEAGNRRAEGRPERRQDDAAQWLPRARRGESTRRSRSCAGGSYFQSFLKPRRTAEKALVAVI